MSKKKGRVQGTFMSDNGVSGFKVPPDLPWDEEMPPTVYECSQHTEHLNSCDGSCQHWNPVKSEVDLMNEARAWARIGMSYQGVPTCFPDGAFDGIKVNIFDLKMRIHTMQVFMIEAGMCTIEDIDEKFRLLKLEALQQIREEYEDSVKLQRMQQMMSLPDKRIIGPHGEPL